MDIKSTASANSFSFEVFLLSGGFSSVDYLFVALLIEFECKLKNFCENCEEKRRKISIRLKSFVEKEKFHEVLMKE